MSCIPHDVVYVAAMPEALKRDIVWLHNVLRCGSSASNMQKMVSHVSHL